MSHDKEHSPRRSCICCRHSGPATEMLELGLVGTQVTVAAPSGRGAWVCIRRSCLEGLNRGNLARSFKSGVVAVNRDELLASIQSLSRRRVLEMIGLARRQGRIEVGIERVLAAGSRDFTVAATDLAERSQRKLQNVPVFLDGDSLGGAAGMGRVGALRIHAGRLASQASYWLSVWYETRGPAGTADADRSQEVA